MRQNVTTGITVNSVYFDEEGKRSTRYIENMVFVSEMMDNNFVRSQRQITEGKLQSKKPGSKHPNWAISLLFEQRLI
jgi:hypothetical protein